LALGEGVQDASTGDAVLAILFGCVVFGVGLVCSVRLAASRVRLASSSIEFEKAVPNLHHILHRFRETSRLARRTIEKLTGHRAVTAIRPRSKRRQGRRNRDARDEDGDVEEVKALGGHEASEEEDSTLVAEQASLAETSPKASKDKATAGAADEGPAGTDEGEQEAEEEVEADRDKTTTKRIDDASTDEDDADEAEDEVMPMALPSSSRPQRRGALPVDVAGPLLKVAPIRRVVVRRKATDKRLAHHPIFDHDTIFDHDRLEHKEEEDDVRSTASSHYIM